MLAAGSRPPLALIALLVLAAAPLSASFDAVAGVFALSAAQDSRVTDWTALRPMPMVTLEIRTRVGMLLVVPAVTLFLLHVFRPRAHVLAGVSAWGASGRASTWRGADASATHPRHTAPPLPPDPHPP